LFAMLWETVNAIDIVRILLCIAILGYSCITDWKIRRASNNLWYLMGALGLILGLFEFYILDFDTSFLISWAISFGFMFILMYGIYYMFQWIGMAGIGGADAKALIAMALLFPYYPQVLLPGFALPLSDVSHSFIFSFTVFGNALVLNFIVPVAILAMNLVTVPFKELLANPIGSFTGYRMKVGSLKNKHVRLMHRYSVEDGKVVSKRIFGGGEVDEKTYKNLMKWTSEGKIPEKVWVTPKIPFLIPITLGLLVAVVYGDILMQIVILFIVH
jgi:archaeal preflagellin peptidase FlaK